jgi:hypothetical protein
MRLTQKLRAAAQRYLDLQGRKIHPDGSFDRGVRWYPDQPLACCASIRTPSRAYPYSLLTHNRSLGHVALDTGYATATLRTAVRRIIAEEKNG